jgi:hypothetical protein
VRVKRPVESGVFSAAVLGPSVCGARDGQNWGLVSGARYSGPGRDVNDTATYCRSTPQDADEAGDRLRGEP